MNEVQGPAPEDFPEGWTLLHDAVLRDDLTCAEALLAEGADARAASRNFCIWEWTGTPPPEEPWCTGAIRWAPSPPGPRRCMWLRGWVTLR